MNPTASALERAAACPPSCALPQVHRTTDAAERGNAGHRFVELVNSGVPRDEALLQIEHDGHRLMCESIDEKLLAHGLASEVAFAYDVATDRAREIGRNLNRQYGALGPSEFAGTADIVGVSPDAVLVEDLKFGFLPVTPPARNLQLRFLGLAIARALDRDRAIVRIARPKEDGRVWREAATLDAFDLDIVALEMREILARVQAARRVVAAARVPDVHEGAWCRWCPSWDTCPAKTALIKRMAMGSEFDELELLRPLDARTGGLALTRVKEARRMLERIESACMATLGEKGYLELPNGKHLRQVVEPGNERIDGRVLYQVAREKMGQAFADDAIEIHASKAALDRALARAAQRGDVPPRGRKKAGEEILEIVRERGGASRPMTKHLVEVDPALPAASAEGEAA